MIELYTIRTYMLIYMCWRIVSDPLEHGNPEYSLPENIYVRISDTCRAFASLRTTTDTDVAELKETMLILHLDNEMLITYPINKFIVPMDDIEIKFYLIFEPLGRNYSNINSHTNNDSLFEPSSIFMWIPINESIVQIDENMTKWVPVNTTSVRRRRDDVNIEWYPVDESVLRLEDNMFKWYPMNDTLVELNDKTINSYENNQSQSNLENDMITWYPINDSLVRLDDHAVRWYPINDSLREIGKGSRKHLKHVVVDDTTLNWYPINESHVALRRPEINVTQETKLIIHGYAASALNAVTKDLALKYYKKNMFNVLLIDAEALLSKIYFKCVKNARLIGKAIADLIIHLESFGADAADFHLIGVSLGAHVAGWAGKYFRQSKGRHIGRITGLDPAGPCFTDVPSEERLDKSDAMFVDVIHSNSLVQGLFEPLGHVDFYLNGGGPLQPGCILPGCSHLAAAFVYTESIENPELFVAVKCKSWWEFKVNQCLNKTALLGHGLSLETRGLYYLRTSGERPYGLGLDGIIPEKI